jgi:hypothetical protein
LGFGIVAPERVSRRAIEIENVGSGECLIYDVRFAASSDPAFQLPEAPPASIAAGAVALVFVEYLPSAPGTHSGVLEVVLSNAGAPQSVELRGTSAGGDLLVVPSEVRFGSVGVGCASRTVEIRAHNVSGVPVPINAVDLLAPSDGFELARVPPAMTLNSGASIDFDVTFRPAETRNYSSAIAIRSTLAGAPADYLVTLEGTGAFDPVHSDRFVQLGASMADILFVVDNSCSMTDEQVSLASNFAAFIDYADRQAIDYHIAVATLDRLNLRRRRRSA